jgi:hypothetical protein
VFSPERETALVRSNLVHEDVDEESDVAHHRMQRRSVVFPYNKGKKANGEGKEGEEGATPPPVKTLPNVSTYERTQPEQVRGRVPKAQLCCMVFIPDAIKLTPNNN